MDTITTGKVQDRTARIPKTKQVFSQKGSVFMKTDADWGQEEWTPINFYWIPILQLERAMETTTDNQEPV